MVVFVSLGSSFVSASGNLTITVKDSLGNYLYDTYSGGYGSGDMETGSCSNSPSNGWKLNTYLYNESGSSIMSNIGTDCVEKYYLSPGRYTLNLTGQLNSSYPLTNQGFDIDIIDGSLCYGVFIIDTGEYSYSCESVSLCRDGTPYESCSETKPLYCENGNLVEKCSICGCARGDCKGDNICSFCDNPIQKIVYAKTEGWQFTSIQVNSNDDVLITATGVWSGNVNAGDWHGPEYGGPAPGGYLAPGLRAGSLVAKTDNNPPFNVGYGNSTTSQTGELYFGFNDVIYSDNDGNVTAYICLQGNRCSDGTPYGECSITNPFYCNNGNLIDNCQICGCHINYTCQDDGSCLKNEQENNRHYSNHICNSIIHSFICSKSQVRNCS